MLYISRWVGLKVMVYDTDDNSEELCTFDNLAEALNSGLRIRGVETQFEDVGFMQIPAIKNVKVWQDPVTCSNQQVKMSLLGHVDVTTFGRLITNIHWRGDKITEPTVVRLSNFGAECADNIFYGNFYTKDTKVIIIFDDKIKVTMGSLYVRVFLGSIGAVFDLHEVKSEKLASIVYEALLKSVSSGMEPDKLFHFIRDSEERLSRYRKQYEEGLQK